MLVSSSPGDCACITHDGSGDFWRQIARGGWAVRTKIGYAPTAWHWRSGSLSEPEPVRRLTLTPCGCLDMRCALLGIMHCIMQLCDGEPTLLCWDESGRMQVTARRATQQQQMTAALSARLAMITTLLRRRDEVVRLVAQL